MTAPDQPRSADGRWAPGVHTEADIRLDDDGQELQSRLADFLVDNPELVAVATLVRGHGATAYLVGGPVRDLAVGLDPKDLDITSPLAPAQFREAMAGLTADASVYDVGEAHGTTGVVFRRPDGTEVTIEHTTHRTEVYEADSRVPTVGFGNDLVEDLRRRDFTVNAVAISLADREVVDPFGGLDDLDAGVLRTPDDPVRTMSEDPLRGFRAVRFAALRGFTVDPATAAAIRETSDRYGVVSIERRRDEMLRVFDAGEGATARALRTMGEMGVRDQMLMGLGAGSRAEDFERSMYQLDGDDVLAALARHSEDPAGTLVAWKVDNGRRSRALQAIAAADECLADWRWDAAFRSHIRKHGVATMARAGRIEAVGYSGRSNHEIAAIHRRIGELAAVADMPLPVDGNDAVAAGLRGPDVGEALRRVEWALCEDPALSRTGALALLAPG